ncbi:MAG: DUF1223 domain-containing protein [Rhodothermales bacterium]
MAKAFVFGSTLVLLVFSMAGAITGKNYAETTVTEEEQDVHAETIDSNLIVLELFTSQGCSSCPPADKFLRELADDPKWAGRVLPLSFHVDYWNYLGWKDPFSKPAWTERQGDYVQAMGGATMYTPQIVIHGRDEAVGSRFQQVRRALEKQAGNPNAHLIDISVESLERGEKSLNGEIKVSGQLPAARSAYALVGIAFQKGLSTDIRKGENAGKTLKNDFVVRNLKVLSQLQESTNLDLNKTFKIALDKDISSDQLGLAVLVQNLESMEIVGAAVRF